MEGTIRTKWKLSPIKAGVNWPTEQLLLDAGWHTVRHSVCYVFFVCLLGDSWSKDALYRFSTAFQDFYYEKVENYSDSYVGQTDSKQTQIVTTNKHI